MQRNTARRRTLTPKQKVRVTRITTDRVGERDTVSGDAWRRAWDHTAWELFRV
jgi:hypothetical protein